MKKVIHWFKNDLRLHDNLALSKAATRGEVICIYIHDNTCTNEETIGAASRWWLHHSLKSLNISLKGNLNIYQGDSQKILDKLIKTYAVNEVYWNRSYEPHAISRDRQIKEKIINAKIKVETFNSYLLWEPNLILKEDKTPYKVFTPFYRYASTIAKKPSKPISKPKKLKLFKDHNSISIEKINLLPKVNWDKKLTKHWQVGEDNAKKVLNKFIKNGLSNYKKGRDFPSLNAVSRLSPYIHFGEISVNYIWHTICNQEFTENTEHFCRELAWREFSYNLIYNFPKLPTKNLNTKFDKFPWSKNNKHLIAWQKGLTGIPLVDAGMRELWQTGYMHNRVRMIVASFLVKNLNIHWHYGERWFWDTLVDANLANNCASWQWVAGCGADAAPYYRIFNPVLQGQKFDPEGKYIRQYIPEIAALPNKYIFNPSQAPKEVLAQSKIVLGKNYPLPIVDLKQSRDDALASYKNMQTL